jgi:ribonuclease HI
MNKFILYTDGGCDRNPGGTGGWGIRLFDGDQVVERNGRVPNTTNNRMELLAAIQGLELVNERLGSTQGAMVEIYTDSQYLSLGMSQWIVNWQRNNWTVRGGQPVKNVDLWKRLLELEHGHDVHWNWVMGHAGDENNTRVDKLVQEAIKGPKAASTNEVKVQQSPGPPHVKLIRREGRPAAVKLGYPAPSRTVLQVEWKDLQGFIEELLRVQREGDEKSSQ